MTDRQSGYADGYRDGVEAAAKICENAGPATADIVSTYICEALDGAAAVIRALPIPADDWPDDAAVERALAVWFKDRPGWIGDKWFNASMRAALRAAREPGR